MGHFLVARWSGVKVLEFGIGIPPRLKKIFRDKKWTEWTLNWLPIGGFVRLKWEDSTSLESKQKDALPMAKWWKQVLILLAGVTMNFLLAGSIFSGLFFVGTSPLHVQIKEFEPNSLISRVGQWTQLIPIFETIEEAQKSWVLQKKPGVLVDPISWSIAEKNWIQRGDIVMSIDTIVIERPDDIIRILSSGQSTYEFEIVRKNISQKITLAPEKGKIWVYVTPNIQLVKYKYPLFLSILHGFWEVYHQIIFSFRTFGTIILTAFSNSATSDQKQQATQGIWGPVAIGKVFVGMAENGIDLRPILIMIAMISLSLWVFNLIPFPALDGWRCLLVLVNQCIHMIAPKWQISPRIEQIIHSFWFMLLIIASILVTWKDIFTK